MGTDYAGIINEDIKRLDKSGKMKAEDISDGYHTFKQLYDHRIRIYLMLCKSLSRYGIVWCSKTHSNGEVWDGWFILGINKEKGKQITYHLPMEYWEEATQYAEVLEIAPEYDGHNSDDVLKRLKNL